MSNNEKPFRNMTTRERRMLVLSLQKTREQLKAKSAKKRAQKKNRAKKKKITFEDPTLQALFEANSEKLKKVLGMK